MALGHVDTELLQQCECLGILYVFRNRPHARFSTDVRDQPDHLLVDRVVDERGDERTVNLDVVEVELLQVAERTVAGTEVIQRQLATQLAQRSDLPFHV